MWKKNFFRVCLVLLTIASLLWIACPSPANGSNNSGDPLTAPSNVEVEEGYESLSVSWTAVQNAAKYKVNYGMDEAWDLFKEVQAPDTTVILDSLTNGSEYSIRVCAIDSGGQDGSWSEPVNRTPSDQALGIPVLETVTGNQQVTVSWEAVTDATGYQIRWKATDTADYNAWELVTDLSKEVTGLTNDTGYEFQVRAVAHNGSLITRRSLAATVKAVPKAPIVAGAPPNMVAVSGLGAYEVVDIQAWLGAAGYDGTGAAPVPNYSSINTDGIIMVQWKPAPGATSYDVYVSSTAVRPDTPTATNVTYCSYWVRNLGTSANAVNPVTRYFWVQAKNSAGGGPIAAAGTQISLGASSGIPADLTAPNWSGLVERADYPQNFKAVGGENSIYLTWDKSDRAAWYEVYYSTSNDFGDPSYARMIQESWDETYNRQVPYKWMKGRTSSAADTYVSFHDKVIPWDEHGKKSGLAGDIFKIYACESTITGLAPGNYFVWVRSLNHNGERGMATNAPFGSYGGRSASAGFTITVGNLPPAPTGVRVTTPTGIGAAFNAGWTAVTGAASYKVYYSKYPTLINATTANLATTNTNAAVFHLDENTRYHVWVSAIVNGIEGAKSAPVQIVTNFRTGNEPVTTVKYMDMSTGGDTKRVLNQVYIEVNDEDPRVALGYVLDNPVKTPYFDEVIIFAANLRSRDCAAEKRQGENGHNCYKTGPHIHLNGNVDHILTNRDKYIKPLQEAGIKVILGTLPDHDFYSYWHLGSNPLPTYPAAQKNAWANWAAAYEPNLDNYPFNAHARAVFCEDLARVIEQYGLDGFDIDDEWSDAPTADRDPDRTSQNMGEFIYLMRKRLDAGTPAGADKKIIAMYAYGGLSYFSIDAPLREQAPITVPGSPAGFVYEIPASAAAYKVNDAFALGWFDHATYGQWAGFITNYNGYGLTSNTQWLPYTPRLGPNITTTPSIANLITMKNADPLFCGISYWCLQSHAKYRNQSATLGIISEALFGYQTVYEGPDYPQDWSKY